MSSDKSQQTAVTGSQSTKRLKTSQQGNRPKAGRAGADKPGDQSSESTQLGTPTLAGCACTDKAQSKAVMAAASKGLILSSIRLDQISPYSPYF